MAFWLLWLLNFWRGNGPQGNLEIRIASKRNSIFALGQTKPVHKMLAISNRQSANNKDFKLIGSFNAEKNHYNNNDDDWWLLARSFVRSPDESQNHGLRKTGEGVYRKSPEINYTKVSFATATFLFPFLSATLQIEKVSPPTTLPPSTNDLYRESH